VPRSSPPVDDSDSGSGAEGSDSHSESGPVPTFVPEDAFPRKIIGRLRSRFQGNDLRGLPGRALGDYWLVRELERGKAGPVFQAEAIDGSGPVAIRLLPGELAADPAKLKRLRRRIEAFSGLTCPFVAKLHGLHLAGGQPFLVEEFFSGEPLASLLSRNGCLSEALGRPVALQLARGLAAIHAAGLVHGDIQPGTVHVTTSRLAASDVTMQVKLAGIGMDEGLADPGSDRTASGQQLPATSAVAGPELATEELRDPMRADLTALGATLAAIFLGESGSQQLVSASRDDPSQFAPNAARKLAQAGLSPSLGCLIIRALAGGDNGYQSAAELAAELEQCDAAGQQAPVSREGTPSRGLGARLWSLWQR
jgi:eukaryotic-like serine/threonine-protein kinase